MSKVKFKKNNQTKAITVVALSTFLTAAGAILLKYGALRLEFNFLALITNYLLILGLLCYGVAMLVLTWGMKTGDLSILYPLVALGYVWITLYAYFGFNEPVGVLRLTGIVLVMVGAAFIGKGAKK
jgi:drug/metabolite transporter (DMT)-like permease